MNQPPIPSPTAVRLPWWEEHLRSRNESLVSRVCALFDKPLVGDLGSPELEREREILAFVMNLWIDARDYDTKCPLRTMVEDGDTRSLLCSRLSERYSEIESIRRRANSPEIRARFSEFVWSFHRGQRPGLDVCRDAVSAYLECCEALPLSRKTTQKVLERLVRALRLSAGIKDDKLQERVMSKWEGLLMQELTANESALALASARVLAGTNSPFNACLAAVLDEQVSALDEHVSFILGPEEEELCDLAASICQNEAKAAGYKAKAALLALNRAKRILAVDQQGIQSVILARAALDRVKTWARDLEMEALQTLHTANSKIPEDDFDAFTLYEIDAAPIIRQYEAKVTGFKTAEEALASLVTLAVLPSKQELIEAARAEAAKPPTVGSLFLSVSWNPDGRSSSDGTLHSNKASERERSIVQRAHQLAKEQRSFFALCAIQSCLAVISAEKGEPALLVAVEAIVANSNFVAAERKEFVRVGLAAALRGDMVQAMHYLIPQLEEAFRFQLVRQDVAAIAPGKKPGEVHVAMFEEVFSRLEKNTVFSEDVLFALRGLLTEDQGGNLRNKHCHGLMERSDYGSGDAYFLVWLVLKLVAETR